MRLTAKPPSEGPACQVRLSESAALCLIILSAPLGTTSVPFQAGVTSTPRQFCRWMDLLVRSAAQPWIIHSDTTDATSASLQAGTTSVPLPVLGGLGYVLPISKVILLRTSWLKCFVLLHHTWGVRYCNLIPISPALRILLELGTMSLRPNVTDCAPVVRLGLIPKSLRTGCLVPTVGRGDNALVWRWTELAGKWEMWRIWVESCELPNFNR